jgi:hypothetical protein
VAGFQVTIIGRFWVTAEAQETNQWHSDRLANLHVFDALTNQATAG